MPSDVEKKKSPCVSFQSLLRWDIVGGRKSFVGLLYPARGSRGKAAGPRKAFGAAEPHVPDKRIPQGPFPPSGQRQPPPPALAPHRPQDLPTPSSSPKGAPSPDTPALQAPSSSCDKSSRAWTELAAPLKLRVYRHAYNQYRPPPQPKIPFCTHRDGFTHPKGCWQRDVAGRSHSRSRCS